MQQEEIRGLMKGTIPFTEKILTELSDLVAEYPYFQTARLLHTLNLLQLKDSRFLYDLRKTAIYVPDRRQLYNLVENNFLEQRETEKEILSDDPPFELIETISIPYPTTDYVSYFLDGKMKDEETPPLQHQDIIDKFLKKDAASPVKIKLIRTDETEEERPEPIPEPPVADSFFTETLAKIFIKQKKYDKALGIIRKLNLIYPEKSRYFADRIRFLEQLIIYTNKNK